MQAFREGLPCKDCHVARSKVLTRSLVRIQVFWELSICRQIQQELKLRETVVPSVLELSSQAFQEVRFALPSDPEDEVNTVLRNI
jgi:hypothetical protein